MSKMPISTQERSMNIDDFIISKTDKAGKLTYCNETFMDMAMMSEHELLGKPHSIVRHPDMPKVVFKLLWEKITQGKEVFAYVKNLAKDGSCYWVFANVTPSYNNRNQIIGYYSVRIKPNDKALEIIKPLYQTLREKEKQAGIDASEKYLQNLLQEKGVNYDEFIITIQAEK